MGKLEELKNLVAGMFENATDKSSIENLAKLNNTISEVEAEQASLVDKNAELIKSYKDLVKHTSFNDAKTIEQAKTQVSKPVSFEDALRNFIANKK